MDYSVTVVLMFCLFVDCFFLFQLDIFIKEGTHETADESKLS